MTGPRATRTKSPRPKVAWTDEVERLYESWHRRVAAAEAGHRMMADRLRRRYSWLGLPVVVFTTVVGTSAFASLQDHEVGAFWLRFSVGAVSILAAALSSLQTFLGYAQRSEGHRIGAVRYEDLRRDMAETRALPREARDDAQRELDSVRQRMDRYGKESPLIGEKAWAKLAEEFHLSKVPPDPAYPDSLTVAIPDADADPAGDG